MNDAGLASRRARAWAAALLGACALVLHLAVGRGLEQTGVLHEWDVLFSADPTVYVTAFSTGRNTYRWGGRSFVHPNISNVLYPVVITVAAVAHAVRPAVAVERVARHVAYVICPLASAVTAATLLLAFVELGVDLAGAVLLVLLYLVSFSGLVFSSIPESYCLTAMAFALLFRTAARTLRAGPGDVATGRWTAVGTLMASVTISNLVSFALVACAVRLRQVSVRRAVAWTAGVTSAALLITMAFYALGARLSSAAPAFSPAATGQIDELHPFAIGSALVEFPTALANTFVPPPPLKAPADPGLRQPMRFTLTYHARGLPPPGETWRIALVLLVLAAALWNSAFLSPALRRLVIAAALVVAFNWVLHTFYGTEMFLYSQHWGVALVVVLAGLVAGRPSYHWARRGLLAALFVVCAWNSVAVLRAVIGTLEAPTVERTSALTPAK